METHHVNSVSFEKVALCRFPSKYRFLNKILENLLTKWWTHSLSTTVKQKLGVQGNEQVGFTRPVLVTHTVIDSLCVSSHTELLVVDILLHCETEFKSYCLDSLIMPCRAPQHFTNSDWNTSTYRSFSWQDDVTASLKLWEIILKLFCIFFLASSKTHLCCIFVWVQLKQRNTLTGASNMRFEALWDCYTLFCLYCLCSLLCLLFVFCVYYLLLQFYTHTV